MTKIKTPFQAKMEKHLIKFKEEHQYLKSKQKKKFLYSELSDNFFPPIRHGVLQYIYENGMPLHDYVNHVRSSQAYCVNVLYPMITQHRQGLIELLNVKLKKKFKEVKGFSFEYSPESDLLGEWKGNENPEEYVTSVDLRLDLIDENLGDLIILIEVKFTENEFSSCGGYNSKGNTSKIKGEGPCNDSRILLNDYKQCYLNGAKHNRNYFNDHLNPLLSFKENKFSGRCPFSENNQCLRNHSLARSLAINGKPCFFGLLSHEGNVDIKNSWDQYKSLLINTEDLFEITGKELIEASKDENLRKYYQDRYAYNEE